MKRVIPDGSKISALRDAKNIKQISLADDLGITDRQLRKVEKENASISSDQLIKLSNIFEISPEELKLSIKSVRSDKDKITEELKNSFVSMRLLEAKSGSELYELARGSKYFNYRLNIDPDKETADYIVKLFSILKCRALGSKNFSDGFENMDFPEIYRISALTEIIAFLNAKDIDVCANAHYRKEYDKPQDGVMSRINKKIFCVGVVKKGFEIEVAVMPDQKAPPGFEILKYLSDGTL